jgi:DNA-binding transcriptional regulator LsrR (DeoR family)
MANSNGRRLPAERRPPTDQLRLLVRVARMYHERGLRQPQIADMLNIRRRECPDY